MNIKALREEWKEYAISELKGREEWMTPEVAMTAVSIKAADWWLSKFENSLEGLIEACQTKQPNSSAGTTFDFLWYGNGENAFWEAGGRIKQPHGFIAERKATGKTPQEAVKNLLIQLQQDESINS